MSEEIKKENNPAEPEEQQENQPNLSRRRRTALVGYLAILFAVAFLLVALSMVIENKRLQSTKQQIEDRSKQTSATLNGKISELQASYDALQKESEELQGQLDTLKPEAERVPELEQSLEALTDERDELAVERDKLENELKKTTDDLEQADALLQEQESLAERTAAVQELLYQAVEADENGRYEELEKLLAQIEPDRDLLCPTALEIYESLAID